MTISAACSDGLGIGCGPGERAAEWQRGGGFTTRGGMPRQQVGKRSPRRGSSRPDGGSDSARAGRPASARRLRGSPSAPLRRRRAASAGSPPRRTGPSPQRKKRDCTSRTSSRRAAAEQLGLGLDVLADALGDELGDVLLRRGRSPRRPRRRRPRRLHRLLLRRPLAPASPAARLRLLGQAREALLGGGDAPRPWLLDARSAASSAVLRLPRAGRAPPRRPSPSPLGRLHRAASCSGSFAAASSAALTRRQSLLGRLLRCARSASSSAAFSRAATFSEASLTRRCASPPRP